jgi:geranylgeranyl diphosphate synthase type II
MGYALLGPGKRIRPVLVLMSDEACGGHRASALTAGCAVEMLHTYSLVHDDLPSMDDDDMRRGRPTCHKVYGEAMAILVGDALLTEAFGIISKQIDSAQLAKALVQELARASGAEGMVAGQAADMLTEGSKGDAQMLEYIHSNKTAKLIRACCRMGALTGGAGIEEIEALGTYGEAVGMAFQVIDDLLDIAGDAQMVGKAVGKDDRAGKLTYPSIVGTKAAHEKVVLLSDQARAALGPLGRRGQKLTELAELLARRVS